jgi:two-component system, chemotaxis family, CheB/CheR fusion protein
LTRENWGSVEFQELLAKITAPYGSAEQLRFTGPKILLPSSTAVSLAMMFNELATNAAQYGALSTATGTVSVKWTVEERPDSAALRVERTERGGPSVAAPTREGFGSRLLRESLPGTTKIEYPTSGLRCLMHIDISQAKEARRS